MISYSLASEENSNAITCNDLKQKELSYYSYL